MKTSIIEVIKANKKVIIKKSLIIGGAIAGVVLASALATKAGEEYVEAGLEATEEVDDEVSENETEEQDIGLKESVMNYIALLFFFKKGLKNEKQNLCHCVVSIRCYFYGSF